MKITLKLFASLSDYLPSGATRNSIEVDVPENASPALVIDRYRLPQELTHLVLVNGVYTPEEERGTLSLRAGDTLAIWPPIAGG